MKRLNQGYSLTTKTGRQTLALTIGHPGGRLINIATGQLASPNVNCQDFVGI